MHPQPIAPIPEDTARVARAAFPKGNVYIEMRNVLGTIYDDEDFAELFEVPHFIFHVGQTHHFSPESNLAQLGGLAFQILLPLVLLLLMQQKAMRRDLEHANVNRTERLE